MDKLKPCPYCGLPASTIRDKREVDNGWAGIVNVFCVTPSCALFNHYIKPEAWNIRHQDPTRIEGDTCEWSLQEDDYNIWNTCGNEWVLNEGSPSDNGMKYCPICGRIIREINLTEGSNDG